MIELSKADLLGRLRSGEDHFNERKTFRDRDGWLKTAVAFANSAPIDWPAILWIGVTDKGDIEQPTQPPNLDELQMRLTAELARAYPPIYHLPKIVTDEAGRQCLAVLIPGSSSRPHFSGKAYVRVGSQSPEASEMQFTELIAQRTSKAGEILKWKEKGITFEIVSGVGIHSMRSNAINQKVIDCTAFHVTIGSEANATNLATYPLSQIEISFDHANSRLKLEYRY